MTLRVIRRRIRLRFAGMKGAQGAAGRAIVGCGRRP